MATGRSSLVEALQQLRKAIVVDTEQTDHFVRTIQRTLYEADVAAELVKQLGHELQEAAAQMVGTVNKKRALEAQLVVALQRILSGTPVSSSSPTVLLRPSSGGAERGDGPPIVLFVGLQGSGKTTTVMKYAWYHMRTKGSRVAVICADTYRAGAYDQLKQNVERLTNRINEEKGSIRCRIALHGGYDYTDPATLAAAGRHRFQCEEKDQWDLILVDTSGRHRQHAALFAEMEQVAAVLQPSHTILVMDALVGQSAREQAAAFHAAVPVGSVVVTKTDGTSGVGGALAGVAATGAYISFLGTGENPDDWEPFDANRYIQRLLGKGDMTGLLTLVKEKHNSAAKQSVLSRFVALATAKKGGVAVAPFCFRDLLGQLRMLEGLGPITSVLNMIPGGSSLLRRVQGSLSPTARITAANGGGTSRFPFPCRADRAHGHGPVKKGKSTFSIYVTVMNSMTPYELDRDNHLFYDQPDRINRVAAGAGVAVSQVDDLLSRFTPFQKLAAGGLAALPGLLKKNSTGKKNLKKKKKKKKETETTMMTEEKNENTPV